MLEINLGRVRGKSAYELWLEKGNVGTEDEFLNNMKGADFKSLEFVRFDDEGNTVVRSKNSKEEYGDEILIKRGPRGYTGGVADGEQPPEGVRYGTIVEWAGGDLPQGWLYTNGGTIEKKQYPHLSSILSGVTQPTEPYFKLGPQTNIGGYSIVEGLKVYSNIPYPFSKEKLKLKQDNTKANSPYYYSSWDCFLKNPGKYQSSALTDGYYYIELPEILYFSFMSMNKINATGNSIETRWDPNRDVDVYIVVEYLDENGEWMKGTEFHNKTDFIPLTEEATLATAMAKSSFKSNKFRFYVDSLKSVFNYPEFALYYVGNVNIGFDKGGAQYTDYLQIPNAKDNQGRYKIIYVGQPLAPATTEMTMFAYDSDKKQTREIPFSLAVENKLPNYVEGITMAEPHPNRIGYVNKYNKHNDTWSLVKTHENKEGYYYDINNDLRYKHKPEECYVWDYNSKEWLEDLDKKIEHREKLKEDYVSLILKRDKMKELNFDTTKIDMEIEALDKCLNKL